jgi:hypothetical protein
LLLRIRGDIMPSVERTNGRRANPAPAPSEIRLLFDQVRFSSVLGIQYTLEVVVDGFPATGFGQPTCLRDRGLGSPPYRSQPPGSSKACSVIGTGEAERAPPLSTEP